MTRFFIVLAAVLAMTGTSFAENVSSNAADVVIYADGQKVI